MVKNIKNNKGFVILFAVTISAILLSIALGVANIALKEVKFGTSARDTNDAFFAADTGIEYALFHDKPSVNSYPYTLLPGNIQTYSNIIVSGLGSVGASCAIVSIKKDNTNPLIISTTIIAKGYNIGDALCDSTNSDRIEREIRTIY